MTSLLGSENGWCYVQPFRHNTKDSRRRTDRETDGDGHKSYINIVRYVEIPSERTKKLATANRSRVNIRLVQTVWAHAGSRKEFESAGPRSLRFGMADHIQTHSSPSSVTVPNLAALDQTERAKNRAYTGKSTQKNSGPPFKVIDSKIVWSDTNDFRLVGHSNREPISYRSDIVGDVCRKIRINFS